MSDLDKVVIALRQRLASHDERLAVKPQELQEPQDQSSKGFAAHVYESIDNGTARFSDNIEDHRGFFRHQYDLWLVEFQRSTWFIKALKNFATDVSTALQHDYSFGTAIGVAVVMQQATVDTKGKREEIFETISRIHDMEYGKSHRGDSLNSFGNAVGKVFNNDFYAKVMSEVNYLTCQKTKNEALERLGKSNEVEYKGVFNANYPDYVQQEIDKLVADVNCDEYGMRLKP